MYSMLVFIFEHSSHLFGNPLGELQKLHTVVLRCLQQSLSCEDFFFFLVVFEWRTFLPYFSKYQCENRQCEPLTVLRACLPAQLILWARLNAGFRTQQCSMFWHVGLETVPAAGTKCLSLNRCRFCLGEWKRSCGNQTLPGFPDAQQNLDPSVVPPAGLYQ